MQTNSSSFRHSIRLLIGAWIVSAGMAILCTLSCLRVTGAPLGPAMLLLAIFGIGPALLLAGALIANGLVTLRHSTPSHPH